MTYRSKGKIFPLLFNTSNFYHILIPHNLKYNYL